MNHGPTIEACVEVIKTSFDPDDPTHPRGIVELLRALPVAGWTRERPTEPGDYFMGEYDANGKWETVHVEVYLHCGKLWVNVRESRLDCSLEYFAASPQSKGVWWCRPLLPPPPKEGE